MLSAASINVARGTQQPSRRTMEAWPAGPLPRGLRFGEFILLVWLGSRMMGGGREMAVSPLRRYLGTHAVAVVQDQDALRLSIHSSLNLLPGQATPRMELKFTFVSRKPRCWLVVHGTEISNLLPLQTPHEDSKAPSTVFSDVIRGESIILQWRGTSARLPRCS